MFAQTFPDVPQVACFDTAFYADVTEEEYLLVIQKKACAAMAFTAYRISM